MNSKSYRLDPKTILKIDKMKKDSGKTFDEFFKSLLNKYEQKDYSQETVLVDINPINNSEYLVDMKVKYRSMLKKKNIIKIIKEEQILNNNIEEMRNDKIMITKIDEFYGLIENYNDIENIVLKQEYNSFYIYNSKEFKKEKVYILDEKEKSFFEEDKLKNCKSLKVENEKLKITRKKLACQEYQNIIWKFLDEMKIDIEDIEDISLYTNIAIYIFQMSLKIKYYIILRF